MSKRHKKILDHEAAVMDVEKEGVINEGGKRSVIEDIRQLKSRSLKRVELVLPSKAFSH